jgi:hypothetical protein
MVHKQQQQQQQHIVLHVVAWQHKQQTGTAATATAGWRALHVWQVRRRSLCLCTSCASVLLCATVASASATSDNAFTHSSGQCWH